MDDYNFSWEQLGDLKTGRPNLGLSTSVEAYRLMQYTMRAVLEHDLGKEAANRILSKAGKLSGWEFCKHNLDTQLPVNKFLAQLNEKLLAHSIGIMRVEKLDPDTLSIILTISEDLDCSGLPVTNFTVCDYDEGFLEGVFEAYTGQEFTVREIDCWATGDRTCRFSIQRK
jgi:predicted hydrocarbon binding protein